MTSFTTFCKVMFATFSKIMPSEIKNPSEYIYMFMYIIYIYIYIYDQSVYSSCFAL